MLQMFNLMFYVYSCIDLYYYSFLINFPLEIFETVKQIDLLHVTGSSVHIFRE